MAEPHPPRRPQPRSLAATRFRAFIRWSRPPPLRIRSLVIRIPRPHFPAGSIRLRTTIPSRCRQKGGGTRSSGGGAIKEVANFIADLVSQGAGVGFPYRDHDRGGLHESSVAREPHLSTHGSFILSGVFECVSTLAAVPVPGSSDLHGVALSPRTPHQDPDGVSHHHGDGRAAVCIFMHFAAIFQVVNNLSENLDNTVSEAIESVADLSASTIYDAAWNIYVLEPWELAQFGHESNDLAKFNVSNAAVGESYTTDSGASATIQPGDNWVVLFMKNTTSQARDSLLNDILSTSQPFAKSSWTSTSVKNANPYNNIIFLLVMFILGLPCLAFLAFMAFILFGFELAFLFSAFMGIFVLPLGFVPEVGWGIVQNWAKKSVGFLLLKLANVVYMAITFLLVTIVMDSVSLTGDEATLITGAITSGLIFLGALMMRHQLFSIYVEPVVARIQNGAITGEDGKPRSLMDEWRQRTREAWGRRDQRDKRDDDQDNKSGGGGSLAQKTLSAAFSAMQRGGGGTFGAPPAGSAGNTRSSRWSSSYGGTAPGNAAGGVSGGTPLGGRSAGGNSSNGAPSGDSSTSRAPQGGSSSGTSTAGGQSIRHGQSTVDTDDETKVATLETQKGTPESTVDEHPGPEAESRPSADAKSNDGEEKVPEQEVVSSSTDGASESRDARSERDEDREASEPDTVPSKSTADGMVRREDEPMRRGADDEVAMSSLADAFATPEPTSQPESSSVQRRVTDESSPEQAEQQVSAEDVTESSPVATEEQDVPSPQLVSEAFVAPQVDAGERVESASRASEPEASAVNPGTLRKDSETNSVSGPGSEGARAESRAANRSELPEVEVDDAEAGALERSFHTPAPVQETAAEASRRGVPETPASLEQDETHTMATEETGTRDDAPAVQVESFAEAQTSASDTTATKTREQAIERQADDSGRNITLRPTTHDEAHVPADGREATGTSIGAEFTQASDAVKPAAPSVHPATFRRIAGTHESEASANAKQAEGEQGSTPPRAAESKNTPNTVVRLQPKASQASSQTTRTKPAAHPPARNTQRREERPEASRRTPPVTPSRRATNLRQRARMGQPLRFDPRRNRNPRDNT
ncbi:hypothetical protein [Alicyclobacillus acidocaldarius]|uniref:TrbL/VirB6 plasmid conjugal transfer protein n=1 Tax=Alicyclobacillus acidocaldarius (strain Tc-4-1) TaxID=1048834 RepID=F8IGN8_ALIAT|nr:hypothetical protein [Alicyclobacillus acidocaldarius]AEJ44318.1 hypothetical protein TC41_2418 [Alicyclobacillus acidocaldarius subsp. acidocaldarius Tc-4-1]